MPRNHGKLQEFFYQEWGESKAFSILQSANDVESFLNLSPLAIDSWGNKALVFIYEFSCLKRLLFPLPHLLHFILTMFILIKKIIY